MLKLFSQHKLYVVYIIQVFALSELLHPAINVIESLEYMNNSQDQLQYMPNQQFQMSQHRTCFASTPSSSFSLGWELDKNVNKDRFFVGSLGTKWHKKKVVNKY